MKIIHITGPKFVAAVCIRNDRAFRCAPILRHINGMRLTDIVRFCEDKGWKCEIEETDT